MSVFYSIYAIVSMIFIHIYCFIYFDSLYNILPVAFAHSHIFAVIRFQLERINQTITNYTKTNNLLCI